MKSDDLERLALEVRARARLDDDDVARAPEIALAVLGPRSLAVSETMRCSGRLERNEDGYVIVVRRTALDLNFTIAHELGHWALLEIARYQADRVEEERAANYLGAAILAPRPSIRKAYRQWGEDLQTTAEAFGLAKTSIVLRLGEVRGDGRFVVTRTENVLRRDSTELSDDDIRRAAKEPLPKGLAKTELVGGIDEGRIALRLLG